MHDKDFASTKKSELITTEPDTTNHFLGGFSSGSLGSFCLMLPSGMKMGCALMNPTRADR
jgi:hypothetical protein